MQNIPHFLGLASCFVIVLTGLSVMAMGKWDKLALKFAAVCLSTTAGMWWVSRLLIHGDQFTCNFSDIQCATGEMYHIVRNIAIILFHIAIGRDAIHFKKKDRRGDGPWMKSSLKR